MFFLKELWYEMTNTQTRIRRRKTLGAEYRSLWIGQGLPRKHQKYLKLSHLNNTSCIKLTSQNKPFYQF